MSSFFGSIEAEHQMAEGLLHQETLANPEPVDQGTSYPGRVSGDIITLPEEEMVSLKWEPVATREVSAYSQIVTERLVISPTLQLIRDISMTRDYGAWRVDRILHTVVRGM
jgi:hypothetical protein